MSTTARRGGGLGVEPKGVNPMRVQKAKQRIIVILMDQTRIKGFVHLPSSGRLSDLMNHQAGDRPFLAMTDAVVRLPDQTRHKVPFISVNRNAVTTCFPTPEEDAAAAPAKDKKLAPRLRPR